MNCKTRLRLLSVACVVILAAGTALAEKGGKGGGNTPLSVTFTDGPIDLTAFGGGQYVPPGIYSDGWGEYLDGVDFVMAITGDGFRLDTASNTSKEHPLVRFLAFDFDGNGPDFLTSVDMRLDREYYADASGNLTDADGIPVSVADRVTKTSRMVPKAMSPNSVARAALFVRFDTANIDGTVHSWRFIYGDSQPDPFAPDAVPVWILAGPDNGSGEPSDWRIVGTTGAQFELVPENPNRKNSPRISVFSGYFGLPVELLLDRLR